MEVLNGGYLVRLLFISLLDLFKKATKKMNIKPVGHFYPEGEGATVYDIKFAWKVTGTTEPIPLYTHPAKELHLSLQKSKETGELLAVTYTDDEHRIVEVLWQKPPTKTLTDEEILECWNETHPAVVMLNAELPLFARAILRKAQEK